MDDLMKQELAEIEAMVSEAAKEEEYTEKVFILREGMIRLTGGFVQAAVLSYLLGWTRHWLKTDHEIYKQIMEAAHSNDLKEVQRLKERIRQGWFYDSCAKIAEAMLDQVSGKSIERYVKEFEERGFIESRDPDKKAIYRAKWYKVNIDVVKDEMNKLGFELDHYKNEKAAATGQNVQWENTGVSAPKTAQAQQFGIRQNVQWTGQNVQCTRQNVQYLLYSSINDLPSTLTEEEELNLAYQEFKKLWVNNFQDTPIDENQMNVYIEIAGKKKLTSGQIDKEMAHIKEFYKDTDKDYASLLYRSLAAGGWVATGKAFTRKKTSSRAYKKKDHVPVANPIPRAVQAQMERGEQPAPVIDANEKASFQAKLKLMHERLNQKAE